eukprot:7453321-Pyramimonas_sp.AAC.1
MREVRGLAIKVSLTIDAESVYKSLSSKDLKIPTERSLLGHISWIRELMDIGVVHTVQWCDTSEMTAYRPYKGEHRSGAAFGSDVRQP